MRRLEDAEGGEDDDDFGADDVVAMALTRHFHRSIATFEHAFKDDLAISASVMYSVLKSWTI